MSESKRSSLHNKPEEWIDAYFDGQLPDELLPEFEAWLKQSPARIDEFANRAFLNQQIEDVIQGWDLQEALSEYQAVEDEPQVSLLDHWAAESERPVLKLSEEMSSHPIQVQEVVVPERQRSRWVIVIPRPLFYAGLSGLAAVLIYGFLWLKTLEHPTALLTDNVLVEQIQSEPVEVGFCELALNAQWDDAQRIDEQSVVWDGEYRLLAGQVRFKTKTGALVMLEAPAHFKLESAHSITLFDGQLLGYCDEGARGFEVKTPYARYVDLGTEFGVQVSPWQESQLHVFEGEVQAEGRSADGLLKPVRIKRDQAARNRAGDPQTQVKANADRSLFVSSPMRQIPLFNTGQALNASGFDEHWQVTRVNGEVLEQPVPTVVWPTSGPGRLVDSQVAFKANEPGQLQWLSVDPWAKGLTESSYTFETSFNLDAYALDTVVLSLRFLADNSVESVRINGRSVPVPEHRTSPPFTDLTLLEIDSGFIKGVNRLEIVLGNHSEVSQLADWLNTNFAALMVDMKAVGRLDWRDMKS